jgi:hypothetical protein
VERGRRSRSSDRSRWIFGSRGAVAHGSQYLVNNQRQMARRPGFDYLRSRFGINLPHGFAGHAAAGWSSSRTGIWGQVLRKEFVVVKGKCCGSRAKGCCGRICMKGGLRLAVLDVVEWRPMRRRRGCKAGSSIFGTATLRNSNYTTRPLHDKYD